MCVKPGTKTRILHTQRICCYVAQMVKNWPAIQETWVRSLGWEDSLKEGMPTHPSFLPGEFHGHRSLEGDSPWGLKESDTIEQLILSLSVTVEMTGKLFFEYKFF